MGLDCYGLLYETNANGQQTCVKYMRHLKGPALNALVELAVDLSFEDPMFNHFEKYQGPLMSQYPSKRVDLGNGYFLVLYWI